MGHPQRDDVMMRRFPLPPLLEQRRIVTRIDQLMALCGTLEARLLAQASTQSALLGSLMDAVTPIRSAPAPRPRAARAAATAPANATQPSPARGRGRLRKADSIPAADSMADAIQRLEALKLERAQGSRQVGLFEDQD